MDHLTAEIIAELKKSTTGEVADDTTTRLLYSTDASVHKMEPLGVIFPRRLTELEAIVSIAAQYSVPLIPRGSGSSLAGQAIGNGLIIDCSRYLDKLVNINQEEMSAVVEPGLILDDLNRAAKKYGLMFGPDPASSERATMGGCIGNNAAGAHSIIYGMTADHILSAEMVLADGSVTTWKPVSNKDAERVINRADRSPASPIERDLYQAVLRIQEEFQEDIKYAWPVTWRRTSGYNLNYLIPWSPSIPPQWDLTELPYPPVEKNHFNLSHLLAGSEGTLGILRKAEIRLVPLRRHKILLVLNFSGIYQACEIVPKILELSPSAVELVPQSLIHLARSVPKYAGQTSFVVGDPEAMLIVEFSSDDPKELIKKSGEVRGLQRWSIEPVIADTPALQKNVWGIRNVGLGILMSRLGDVKPATFIEDMSVPVEQLAEFVSQLDGILRAHGTEADYYGHASAGCLHIRPLLNLKTAPGRSGMRSIATAAVELVMRLGGAVSGEHGDGIARGEFIERAYGPRIVEALRLIKKAADPQGIMNPGKIVDVPPMDTMLRYDEDYSPHAWVPVMTFACENPSDVKLTEAIEQCNGVGVCRKSEGVMCPSFQATRDELYSTRGRANLLRAMLSTGFSTPEEAMQAVKLTLDKCLACKGCKAECPSAVDMAKLKYEFYEHYYSLPGHHHPLRDYLFGYIDQLLKLGHIFPPLANLFISGSQLARMRQKYLGLSTDRKLPALAKVSLRQKAASFIEPGMVPDCLFLIDAFNEYFYPDTGVDALQVMKSAGCKVRVLKTIGAGRTLISKGFLRQARKHAMKLLDEIKASDPEGNLPIVGLEPSEIYTLKDEYLDFFPDTAFVKSLSERAYMVDEFLLRPSPSGQPWLSRIPTTEKSGKSRTDVLVHGHCYQKAQPPADDGFPTGTAATVALLEKAGYSVSVIDDGCCGMAGAFGYENEHYELSMQVGALAMFPAIKRTNAALIAAAGISCQSQILDGTGRPALHPITLVARRCLG